MYFGEEFIKNNQLLIFTWNIYPYSAVLVNSFHWFPLLSPFQYFFLACLSHCLAYPLCFFLDMFSKIKFFFSCLNLHGTKCHRHALLALVRRKFYFLHTSCCWVVLANISQELKFLFSFWKSKISEFLAASWKFSTTGGMLPVQIKLEVTCCCRALLFLPCNDRRNQMTEK